MFAAKIFNIPDLNDLFKTLIPNDVSAACMYYRVSFTLLLRVHPWDPLAAFVKEMFNLLLQLI